MANRKSQDGSRPQKNQPIVSTTNMAEPERHYIYVRSHTPARRKKGRKRRWSAKWPRYCLILDTETSVDATQRLNFGCYRRCKLENGKYLCIEEGLFYADNLPPADVKTLERYRDNKKTTPNIEWFPAKMTLRLMTRSSFVNRIFWRSIKWGELVVGFNLPFDLSRLAVRAANGRKGSWSLALSTRKSRKTGKLEPNPERPRIVITSMNSKMAFIKLGSILHRDEWSEEAVFSI
jgi:hypothetical protein